MSTASGNFDGGRLTEIIEARKMTRAELSQSLQVSRQAVSQYEKGQRRPSGNVMFRMARILGVPLHFFLGGEVMEVSGPVFFRSMAAATKSARVCAKRRYAWAKKVVKCVREFVEFPRVNFPRFKVPHDPIALTDEEIERIALETRRFWGLGEGPISNVVWLLENNGAIVVRQDLPVKTLDAFSEWSKEDDTPYFVLGAGKGSAVRSRLDAAHELGHMVLHRHARKLQNSDVFRKMEEQAYYFAGAFLLPARSFEKDIMMPTLRALVLAKAKWKVSIGAMIKRMGHLCLLSPAREQRMFANYSRRGWRTNEPLDDEIEMEEPRFIRRSFDLLIKNGVIGADDLESRLGLYTDDIEKVIGLAGYFRRNEKNVQFPRMIRFNENME
jgi:Zn-dependent peptidase ImmA (M78 family)/transcriptional regulator with XRE-family HTH domain